MSRGVPREWLVRCVSCGPGDQGCGVEDVSRAASLVMVEHLSSHHTLTHHLGGTVGGAVFSKNNALC